jgi:hypothetical protein
VRISESRKLDQRYDWVDISIEQVSSAFPGHDSGLREGSKRSGSKEGAESSCNHIRRLLYSLSESRGDSPHGFRV